MDGADGSHTGSEFWEEAGTIFAARIRDDDGGERTVELEPERMNDDDPELTARVREYMREELARLGVIS